MQAGPFQKVLHLMTLINLVLKDLLPDTASREKGKELRNIIMDNLKNYSTIEIDFSGVVMTPSFADEAFGMLSLHMTVKELKEKINFLSLTPAHKALLTHVIANRFTSPS